MAQEAPHPRRRRKCSLPTVLDVTPIAEAPAATAQYARGYKLPVDSQPLVPIHTPVPLESERRRPRRVDSQPLVPIHTPSQLQLPDWRAPEAPRPTRWSLKVRWALEMFVLITLIVLLLKSFLGEAFLVPTGSMSPVLRGYHKSAKCPCCGHLCAIARWGSGLHEQEAAEVQRQYNHACCPNCGWDRLGLEQSRESAGDRLLVHKHLFQWRSPRRWEWAIFQHPSLPADGGGTTYVKRLVGLPGESVQIRDGEIYIQGRLARKPLAVLREMRHLVYDDTTPPNDAPPEFRWHGTNAQPERGKRAYLLQPQPTDADYGWLTYRHLQRTRNPGQEGWEEADIRDQLECTGERQGRHLVHDLMVTGQIEPRGATWFALALTDGYDDVLLEIPLGSPPRPARMTVKPAVRGEGGDDAVKLTMLAPQSCDLAAEGPTAFEAALVDRTVHLTLNGRVILAGHPLPDAGPERVRHSPRGRLAVCGEGPVSLGGRGGSLRVKDLRLYRDVYYTGGSPGHPLPHGIQTPVRLGADEFFVLGDHSANSYDSRCWPCGPAVRRAWLLGKPCLVHFPFRWAETGLGGERRLWALPDWSRMRIPR